MPSSFFTKTGTSAMVMTGVLLVGAVLRAGQLPVPAPGTPAPAQDATLFETRIRPLLAANCFACHGESAMAGLRVDSRAGLLRGGETGPAIVPGDPDKSALLKAVQHAEGFPRMPRGRAKLQAGDIDAIAEWIRGGAVWPSADETPAPVAVARARDHAGAPRVLGVPAARPSRPRRRFATPAWPRTDIDRFVLARLERDGLTPVAAADKLTLIRRATLDLTGLPPTPEEVDAFLADASPDAFDKVVDRLLASPRYGETWGRMWLDVARYGEDDYRSLDPMGRGFNPYPNALSLSRLGDPRVQRRPAVRPVRHGAARRRPARRARRACGTCRRSGFLGLGPVVLRQRRGRNHARRRTPRSRGCRVSRGFLGSPSAARAATTTSTIRSRPRTTTRSPASSSTPSTPSIRSRRRPSSTTTRRKEKKLEAEARSCWPSSRRPRARQLAETLALPGVEVHAGRVAGDRRAEEGQVAIVDEREARLRAVRPLAGVPREAAGVLSVPAKTGRRWSKRGGTAKEAKKLADEFQALLLGVMFEQREIKEENDIITARRRCRARSRRSRRTCRTSSSPTTTSAPAAASSCKQHDRPSAPRCGPTCSSANLDPRSTRRGKPAQARAAALHAAGDSSSGSAAIAARYIEGLRNDIEAMEKALPPKYAYVHGVRDVEKPVDLKVHLRGNPMRLGDDGAARLPLGAAAPASRRRSRRAAAGSSSRDAIVHAADRAARDRQPHLEGALRHRPRRHAEQLRHERRAADASRAARLPGAVLRRSRACRSRRCTARSC